MYQERSFAAQRCWLVICQSRPNTYTNNTIYISKTAASSDKLCKSPSVPTYHRYNLYIENCIHFERCFPRLYMFLMCEDRSFAARRCWLVICMSLPNTIPSIQFIYRKLHRHRTNIARIIIVFPHFFTKNGGHLGFWMKFDFLICPCHFCDQYSPFIENRIKIEPVVLEL